MYMTEEGLPGSGSAVGALLDLFYHCTRAVTHRGFTCCCAFFR